MPPDVVRRMFVPVMVTLQQDQVPNIRMNVAKAIQQMYPAIKGQLDIEDRFRVMLREFVQNDSDQDVKYFAQKALQSF